MKIDLLKTILQGRLVMSEKPLISFDYAIKYLLKNKFVMHQHMFIKRCQMDKGLHTKLVQYAEAFLAIHMNNAYKRYTVITQK